MPREPLLSDPLVRPSRRWPAAVLAAAAVVAAVAASQSSLAYWNAAEPTETLSIVSGTAALAVVAPSAAPGSVVFPGKTVSYGGGGFANTGDVPLTVTVLRTDADAFAAALVVKIGAAASTRPCSPTETIPPGGTASLGRHVPGADYVMCASVSLGSTAVVGPGATTSVRLDFTGVQS